MARVASVLLGLLLGGAMLPAQAVDFVSGSVGALARPSGSGAVNDYRLTLGWQLPWQWWDNQVGVLQSRAEFGIGYSHTQLDPVWTAIAAPVLHYQFKTARPGFGPFVELSVGLALLSTTEWTSSRDLHTHWQFADRAGVGYAFDRQEVSVDFLHFSNADLDKPNPGGNVLDLRYSYRF